MAEFLNVFFTAALSFVALFIIAKIMGKKQISQLDFIDYAVGISIGSIAAQMATDASIPFYHYLAAMSIYMLLDIIVAYLSVKSIWFRKIFRGKHVLLINDGKLLYENLSKSKLDLSELLAMCRAKDYFNINDIAFCIFETNGDISILPKSHATPLVSGDMNISTKRPYLSIDFILDGQIIDNAIKQAGKTKAWLLDKLKEKSADNLENIALVNYNIEKDDISIYYKKYKTA